MINHKIKLPDVGKGNEEFNAESPITPPEGGVFTPIKEWAYPYKGYPVEMTVEILAAIKGFIPVSLRFIEQSIRHFDLLALWSLKNTWPEILLYGGKILHKVMPNNPKRFGRAVREIYRVLSIQIDKETEHQSKCDFMNIRAIICVICEFDNAYRYRFQDFFMEIDKINLIKHPIKELRRVLDLTIKRENRQHIANKWRWLKLILTLLFIVKPKFKDKIVEVLSEINKEEIRFEDDDWYCIAMRNDYNFGGLTQEEVINMKGFEKRSKINGV